jgi:hypothetical protein
MAFCVPLLSPSTRSLERFTENGIPMDKLGIVQADHPMRRPDAHQILCIQTLGKYFPKAESF